jgi:MinD superfamily P-loop ATPase
MSLHRRLAKLERLLGQPSCPACAGACRVRCIVLASGEPVPDEPAERCAVCGEPLPTQTIIFEVVGERAEGEEWSDGHPEADW